MPNSYKEYTTGLTGTSFTGFDIKFISEGHLKVLTSTDGGSTFSTTSLTVTVSNNTATLSNAPSTGSDGINKIRIYRQTGTDQLIDFQNGSRLSESDLDTAYQQGLFVSQEVFENGSNSILAKGDKGDAGADATIGVGSIDLDKLSATGTKDATTFLRGDNTFAAPAGNSPYFSAYLSANQSLSGTTKIAFDTEVTDTEGVYDNSSNYRFTAPSAGLYYIAFHIHLANSNTGAINANAYLYKNGSAVHQVNNHHNANSILRQVMPFFNLMSLAQNDYLEVYANMSGTDPRCIGDTGTFGSHFIGFKLA